MSYSCIDPWEVHVTEGSEVLRIFNPNLLPDLLHQLSQEKGLIQGEDRALLEPLLEALAYMLGFVPQAGRVVEVERVLGLRIRIVEGSVRGVNFLAAPEWGCHHHGSLGPEDTSSVVELDLKLSKGNFVIL